MRVTVDQTGTFIQKDDYYPIGLTFNSWTDMIPENQYKYNGNEVQVEIPNVADFNARFYDASLGRFMMIDPLADVQESFNPYHFSYNNPILFKDPTGLLGEQYSAEAALDEWRNETTAEDMAVDAYNPTNPSSFKRFEFENSKLIWSSPDLTFTEESNYDGLKSDDPELLRFAKGFNKALGFIARYDAWLKYIKEDRPHFVDPYTGKPKKDKNGNDIVPDQFNMSKYVDANTIEIDGWLDFPGGSVHYYYTKKKSKLVSKYENKDNLAAYKQGTYGGPAIKLNSGSKDFAYAFFSDVKTKNVFFKRYYTDRYYLHLESFRKR
ncbi:MAG: RHS repeat-associated core domain-containing protein [Cyclobacteriaceae bacterium]